MSMSMSMSMNMSMNMNMNMNTSMMDRSEQKRQNELQADASFLETVPLVELHKSNILKLEMEELLHECRMTSKDDATASPNREYIALLSNIISKLAAGESGTATTTSKKDVVGCPFVLQSDKVATTTIALPSKPMAIVPTGSHAIQCGTKKAGNANVVPTVDCAIVIPNDYWNSKDYLNHRYMDKRNLILWKVANFLSEKKYKKHVGTVEWRHYNGNQATPALILTPPAAATDEKRKKKKKKSNAASSSVAAPKFRIQLVMAMESLDWIPAPRLFPNRCNIKQGTSSSPSKKQKATDIVPTSPYYNAILTRDAFWIDIKDVVLEDLSDLPHFADAYILLKVWCLQRGFLRGHDSLDELQLAVLLLYLYRTKRASPRMAPLQVITVWMKFMAEEWKANKVYVLPEEGRNEAQTVANCEAAKLYIKQTKESPLDSVNGDPATLVKCHEQYSCRAGAGGAVLLDPTMLGNYLGTLSPAHCESLRRQAGTTVTCLNSTRSFASLFMTNARFWNCMDAYLHVPLKDIAWKKNAKNKNSLWAGGKQQADLYDYGEVECLSRGLVGVLRRALGDRVSDVRLLTTGNGNPGSDADQIPTHPMAASTAAAAAAVTQSFRTSMEMETLVVGLKINIDNCHRAVDRGPPADDTQGVQEFLDLWGNAAELRRFKDGAIVHAVVWNTPDLTTNTIKDGANPYVVFEGDERTQGGIVERITQHIVSHHFCREGRTKPQFLLRDMLAMVEGVRTPSTLAASTVPKLISNTSLAHRSIMSSFDSLTNFLRKSSEQPTSDTGRSPLGLPLQIDAVEPLSPSLRYSSPFPAIPHPLLGGDGSLSGKVSGVISGSPIHIQLRFGRSSKWPTDLKAMGAAKTAMLVQIADGIEAMKKRGGCREFEGPIVVTPTHLTLGYNGYSWKIVVRADPELHLLRGLHKPSDDAARMLRALTKEHITAASHHATIHGVHTSHPSAGHVVRLVHNWLSTHMLSGLFPFEAIELLVAKVYSDKESPLEAPSTVVSGFMRVLHVIATYDWVRKPMVVDPHGHLTDDDLSKIDAKFHTDRGSEFSNGPIMYIVAPYDCVDLLKEDGVDTESQRQASSFASWRPTYTQTTPERVTLFRAAALAKRSYSYLLECLTGKVDANKWTATFKETQASLKSYGILLRVDKDFIIDTTFSSTGESVVFKNSEDGHLESMFSRSAKSRYDGPKALRRKVYKNLSNAENLSLLYDWKPVEDTTDGLRRKLGSHALLFYNELAPEVIALLWRPSSFRPKAFSAVSSESVRPVQDMHWKSDSMAMDNVKDFMRELNEATRDIVVDVKVLDNRSHKKQPRQSLPSKKRNINNVSDPDSDDQSADSE